MLNIMNPPADWSTLKKLIWLRGTPINGGEDLTVTGTPPLTLPNSLGKPLKAWSVELSPYQDLHGYDNPWPAGGGKNKVDSSNFGVTNPPTGITLTKSGETITVNGSVSATTTFSFYDIYLPTGTYYCSCENSGVNMWLLKGYSYVLANRGTFTVDDATQVYRLGLRLSTDTTYTNATISNVQIEIGSTSSTWSPYSNLCPIHGTDKVTVWTSGKNLIKTTGTSKTESEVTWTVNDDGTISVSGTATGYSSFVVGTAKVDSSMGYITISGIGTATNIVWSSVILQDDNDNTVYTITTGSSTLSFTVDMSQYPTATKVYVSVKRSNNVATSGVVKPMVEFGSTATEFTPYIAPSQTVLTLPQTVYTGTIGSEGGESRSVKVIPNIRNKQSTNQYGISNWAFNFDPPIAVDSLSMCNLLKKQTTIISQTTDDGYFLSNETSGYLRLDESIASTVAECNQWIADNDFYLIVTLSAPDQFPLTTPDIPTPKGTATTWATSEDGTVDSMSVTYVGKASS